MSDWKRNRLRVLRAERRLTQFAVAKKLGISQAKYWQIETAVREPALHKKDGVTRGELARALGVTVDDLEQAS